MPGYRQFGYYGFFGASPPPPPPGPTPLAVDPATWLVLHSAPQGPPPLTLDPGLLLVLFGTPPPPPCDLLEASVAHLRSLAPLAGGWHSGPSASAAYPLGRVIEVGETESYMSGAANPTVADGMLQISVFANDRATAKRMSDQARDALYDAQLKFTTGRLRNLRPAGVRRVIDEPHPTVMGASLFHAIRQFAYTIDSTE